MRGLSAVLRILGFLLFPALAAAGESWPEDRGGAPAAPAKAFVRFAAIGDGGTESDGQVRVSRRVKSWAPEFVITLGDNNYPDGAAATMDQNIGKYWREFIHPYRGSYGKGAAENRFFPSLGNHDWRTPGAAPYLDFFTLPGNERYYEFARGPVHLYSLDSDSSEPDGIGRDGRQAQWLRKALAASAAPWKIVYFHHPPYSSGRHGSSRVMRWPFKEWGADAVLAGHDHHYERLDVEGVVYFVNGLGGKSSSNPVGEPLPGSRCLFNEDDGAMLVEADSERIDFRFVTADGVVVDAHTLRKPAVARVERSVSPAIPRPAPAAR